NVHATEVDGSDWQGAETSDLSTPSLWGEPRALLVHGVQALPEQGVRELEAYIAAPAPEAVLVITAAPRAGKPPKWSESVKAAGGAVRQVALRRQDLPRWLLDRAASRRLELT